MFWFALAHQKAVARFSPAFPPLSSRTDSLQAGLFNGFAVLHCVPPLRVINPSFRLFFPCESGSEKQGKSKQRPQTSPKAGGPCGAAEKGRVRKIERQSERPAPGRTAEQSARGRPQSSRDTGQGGGGKIVA